MRKSSGVYDMKVYCTIPTSTGKYAHLGIKGNFGRNNYASYTAKYTTSVCRNNFRKVYRILRKDMSAFKARCLMTSMIHHDYEFDNGK